MTLTIKILIAIVILSIAYYSYRKKKIETADKAYKEYRKNLAIESRARDANIKNTKKEEPLVVISDEEKNESLKHLYQCIDIIVNGPDAKKLKSFIDKKIKSENQNINWDVKEEFINQEIINFQFHEDIYFYGHLDGKQSSSELETHIVKALKKNFGIDFDSKIIINIEKEKFIHQAFHKFENELNKIGIALRDVDTDSDSYQIVLIKKEDLNNFTSLIDKLGFKVRKVQT